MKVLPCSSARRSALSTGNDSRKANNIFSLVKKLTLNSAQTDREGRVCTCVCMRVCVCVCGSVCVRVCANIGLNCTSRMYVMGFYKVWAVCFGYHSNVQSAVLFT